MSHPVPRPISLFTATCIVIANMIGTGIFTSLGYQVGPLPSPFAILALWLVGGVCACCGALVYGELAAALPRSGGEYHFLSVIYHPAIGFLAGWISLTVGFAAPIAVAAMAFGSYFHGAFPGSQPLLLSAALVVALTLVHLAGPAVGGRFQNFATTLKVGLILVLIVAGALIADPQSISWWPQPVEARLLVSPAFAVSLVYVMYAYSGWNATVYIVAEVRHPQRTVPFSIALGTALVTLLYLLLNGIFLYAAPMSEMAGKIEVAHIAANHIFGAAGGRVMSGLICAGLIASVSAMTWIGPRVAATMGEDWPALALLARRTRSGLPAVAMLLQMAVVLVLLFTAAFQTVLTYVQFSLSLCSFLTVLGVYVLRLRQPHLARPFRTWGYPVTPFIYLAVNLWMLWHILRSSPLESLAGLGTIALGLVIYLLSPQRRQGNAALVSSS